MKKNIKKNPKINSNQMITCKKKIKLDFKQIKY